MGIWFGYQLTENNNTAVNICVQVFEHVFSVLGIYLGEELLGHMIITYLTFWEFTRLFSTAAVSFYISSSSLWSFQFLHICYFQV